MRVVYYTHSAFFEPALCLVRELSRRVDLDLLLEISPHAWQTAAFDVGFRQLPAGIVPAGDFLATVFPPAVRAYWESAAGVHLVSHRSHQSLTPASWTLSRRVLRFARERRADVLHVDDVDVSPRLAIGLPLASHPPLVIAVHDPEPHSGERNWRKRLARRLAYPHAARFVLYNAALRDRFSARYGVPASAVTVAPLGVYDVFREWASASPADGPPTVLFFGRLSPYKGLELFYEAAPLIARRVGHVRLVVAGQPVPGYTPPAPPVLARPAAIDVFPRYLSNVEVAALFQSARVAVCPYRDATQSGVVLTAFAFGVPVVAAAVGGLPEYVVPDETGLLVPHGDAGALAEAVCRILLDAPLAARLRRGIGEAAADRLSWRRTADALARTYAAL